MNIKGKVVIVTGASSGIGLATARLVAERGARVGLVARSKERLDNLSKEIAGSWPIRADMMQENDIIRMVKETINHFGRVDVPINSAGQGYDAPVEKINVEAEIFAHDWMRKS